MPAATATPPDVAPIKSPWLTVILAWLIPGAGHLFVGRRGRALIIFPTVILPFVIGVLLHGPFFDVSTATDTLSRLIAYGGRIADIAAGLPYFITSFSGYAPALDLAGHDPDYGSKFIVAAGLINMLAMVDAYQIANREKE